MEFSRQEYWSRLPFPPPGVRPDPRIKPMSYVSCIGRQIFFHCTRASLDDTYHLKSESEVAQLCPTLCDPMHCSLLGLSIRGILHARILEWVAISFSKRSFQPRDRTQAPHIAGRSFTIWPTREAHLKENKTKPFPLPGPQVFPLCWMKFILDSGIVVLNLLSDKMLGGSGRPSSKKGIQQTDVESQFQS